MQFEYSDFKVLKDITIETPLDNEEFLLLCDIENVDRVGFDLTTIEQAYYKANGLDLNTKILLSKDSYKSSWDTVFSKWVLNSKIADDIYIDHSGLYGVYPFAGRAKEQIKKYIPQRPELAKLYNIKGKVGYDICIDFIKDSTVVEILHLEHDFGIEEYAIFMNNKERLEQNLPLYDWSNILEKVLGTIYLEDNESITLSNYKASLFGFNKAFRYYNRL
jgi:hypothetical protein